MKYMIRKYARVASVHVHLPRIRRDSLCRGEVTVPWTNILCKAIYQSNPQIHKISKSEHLKGETRLFNSQIVI